jgi:hypothetical protein
MKKNTKPTISNLKFFESTEIKLVSKKDDIYDQLDSIRYLRDKLNELLDEKRLAFYLTIQNYDGDINDLFDFAEHLIESDDILSDNSTLNNVYSKNLKISKRLLKDLDFRQAISLIIDLTRIQRT